MPIKMYLRVGGDRWQAKRGIIGLDTESSPRNASWLFHCIHPEHSYMRIPNESSEKYKELFRRGK